MKREKHRLHELQEMAYLDYLQTPEWQATRRAALRLHPACELCQGTKQLEVYHTSLAHQGCEQEEDVMVLCKTCAAKELGMQPTEQETAALPAPASTAQGVQFTLGQKAAVFAPAAAIGLAIPALLHAPLPAEILGLVGAWALAAKSPEIYAALRNQLPPTMAADLEKLRERKERRLAAGEYTVMDRLLGRHLQPAQQLDAQGVQESEEEEDAERSEEASLTPVFPPYPDDETLRLGQAIDRETLRELVNTYAQNRKQYATTEVVGRRFDPHIDALFGAGMTVAAVQGSGKSILCGLVIEQAGKCGSPAIVLDHKGEYATLGELPFLHVLLAGGPEAQRQAEQLRLPFFALTPATVSAFVQKVMQERLQAVVLLPSYGDGWLDRAQIVAAVGQGLMRYAQRQRAQSQEIIPCLVLLDEAQLYIPEKVGLLPPEARQNTEILQALSNAFFALVSNGRSNGYTMCFATQSLTYIAKWAIKSCQIRIFMRHAEHNDLNMCEEILGGKGVATREDMESLPPGVGVVFGFTQRPMLVKFDKRQSRDLSETPGIRRLRRAAQTAPSPHTGAAQQPDLSTVMAWYTTGKIDEATMLTLLKALAQTETPSAGNGKRLETARQDEGALPGNTEKMLFPVSRAETERVSIGGNAGNASGNALETASQAASGRVITNLFPVSNTEAETPVTRTELDQLGVSAETLDNIQRMKEKHYTDREISEIVGLRGRKYEVYKKVLLYLEQERKRA
ncbi:uncharacterized protein DUF87 [Thermosporothrix hazakensis]|jgi:hypothetical protein|uniref:Uncharacterized protein DUF87 n=1 Tax=Thermosporothrix hazakensis TaxID=644383 RepID=A0A326TVM9_THEHA|nr:DUF87 domain-containing protein [Thermosporothrix hazakensis]PZW20986.1 uncharacterized protein DUF87 [Thermosporothrix hazakensis]GCE49269.1 hypothetical protein KTH_41380 [Thermosporothrix hazakensis]